MFGDFADPVFQHTAARRRLEAYSAKLAEVSAVSTHSRPKAAGKSTLAFRRDWLVSTHSRPKAAVLRPEPARTEVLFQHTAARRRLVSKSILPKADVMLFQHTAARRRLSWLIRSAGKRQGFNTQPPEGGWLFGVMRSVEL